MRRTPFILLAVLLAAFALRVVSATDRPMHTDEAVNAFIIEEALSDSGYHYRPNDHHGPSLFLIAAPTLRLAGVTAVVDMEAWMLRLFPALFGAITAAGAFAFRRELGKTGAWSVAALLALGAPFVYYGGYFIHETLLITLTLALFAALWRFRRTGDTPTALAGGALVGLMLATKETAAPIALVMAAVTLPGGEATLREKLRGLLYAFLAALATTALIFSGFGLHPERLAALVDAARLMTSRGLGDEHAHPFFTYLRWFFAPSPVSLPWSGWLLLSLSGVALALRHREHFTRVTAAWAVAIFLLQSALPYKTPWLALAFLLPLVLLAGVGVRALCESPKIPRVALAVLTIAALATLSAETWTRCRTQSVNPGNPLAYSPSGPDVLKLERDLETAAGDAAHRKNFTVAVVARDYWPLPWTLRKFPRTGYFPEPPEKLPPGRGLLIGGPESLAAYAELAPFTAYEIRPGVTVFAAPYNAPVAP